MEPVYTVEALIKGGVVSEYQPDFVRAILGNETYTIKAAKSKLAAYFSKKEAK